MALRYLTSDPDVVDARPCFDPSGKLVLFMHQPLRGKNKDQIALYTIPAAKGSPVPLQCAKPDSFYFNPQLQATRPDWSWTRKTYEIAFSGNSNQLWLLDATTRNAQQVNCSGSDLETLSYPSWTQDGTRIVLTNYAADPKKQRLLRTGTIPATPPFSVACTDETNPGNVWPGMSSVSPANADLVAFAGQVPNLINTYDQNWNQIWVKQGSDNPKQINGIQGRAPWFSPTGDRIAYESILTPTDGFNPSFRIWVMPYPPPAAPPTVLQPGGQMVTPAELAVQHAKWSPDGTKIVFAYNIWWAKPVDGNAPQGIAIVDVPPA
jgi:Tol biopolymer transport system component